MEKLQQAVQQARAQRMARLQDEDEEPRAPGASSDLHQAPWEALAPFNPQHSALRRNRIVSVEAGNLATPFDIMRTKVLLTMRKNGWRRLAVTSPSMACGKTTASCNLALGFARQPDLRTVLLELDLRRPSVARTLSLEPKHETAEMLTGHVRFADQAVRFGNNVAISASKAPTPDPTSVLLSQRTNETLEQIEKVYAPDLIIFDLPPLLYGDDTRAFIKQADCALLIARAESTTVSQIDSCEREISEQTNMLGVVLNQCRYADDATPGYSTYA